MTPGSPSPIGGGRSDPPLPTAEPSTAQILRANIVTRFNLILGALLVLILVIGPLQDALFGFVIVSNTAIGTLQELRARRTLRRLALLHAPSARVLRGGTLATVAVSEVATGDVLWLAAGDQVVADGRLEAANGLEVDESLVTGEADPRACGVGETLLAGSFVTAGGGRLRATAVGADCFAGQLTVEARRYQPVRSRLQRDINRFLTLVGWTMPPAAALLLASQLARHIGVAAAIRGAVAGTTGMVPQGLVLLTSLAFAIGAVRLATRGVLLEQLPALDGLARVDVLCFDKTGTLTEPELAVRQVTVLDPAAWSPRAASAMAGADPSPNPTLRALALAFPPDGETWRASSVIPFSSARRWSGAELCGHGAWVLGAPDVLLRRAAPAAAAAAAAAIPAGRAVLLAAGDGPLDPAQPPPGLRPVALIQLDERLRGDAAQVVAFLRAEGVTLKVLSGDHPAAVGAVAARVGLADARPVDAGTLPHEPAALGKAVEGHTVFGRVLPHQKQAIVRALRARGHVVAMSGDGVNDVLAVKDADFGIAMGSGAAATRAVAKVVLLRSEFQAVPQLLAESRRVIANIERVASLFITETLYSLLLAVAVAVGQLRYPFYPRHLTVISSLTIGIPAFLLALEPNRARPRPGFVSRVARRAVPGGIAAAAGTLGAFEIALHRGAPLGQARTVATCALFIVGMAVVVAHALPLTRLGAAVIAAMTGLMALILAVPPIRRGLALPLPPGSTFAITLIAPAAAVLLLVAVWWVLARPAPAAAAAAE